MTEAEGLITDDLGHLRQMADTIKAVFWLSDAKEPRILYVSPTYERIWGRDRARLYTHYDEFFESIHPDDRERVQAASSHCISQERFEVEYRVVRPDGEVRWVRDHGFLIRDQAGAPDRLVGFAEDVTEHRQTEQASRELEAWYRTLFEAIDEGFILCDVIFDENDRPVDIFYVEANAAATRMTGQALVGRRTSEIAPNFESHWLETFGRVARTGEAVRMELSATPLNAWYEFYAFRPSEANNQRVAAIYKDITERKRREANLAFLTEIQNDFARLTAADEIMQTVGAKIGLYLNLSICAFADVDEARDEAVIHYNWHREDAPNVAGIYRISEFVTEEFHAAARAGKTVVVSDTNTDARTDAKSYAALNINSFISVPFLRDGQWKFLLNVYDSRSRDWREDEIELFRELSNRLFPRLERARAEATVAADLQDMQLLRELGARLVTEGDIQTLYQEIMSAAIVLTRADAGTVQILDEATQELVLLATQGFERNMTEHFYRIKASSNLSCGIALLNGYRTFVDFDVPESEDPDGSLRMHMDAGYLSAQSTPLITRADKLIGMVSTHWRKHRRPSDRELRFLDLLARQAADLIEQRQTEAEREQLLAREQSARAEADRANRIKDEFLAVLSHELRSPLNPILGWSKLLQSGKLDAARTQQALKTIERNAQLQSELIEDLLDVSRILCGKLSLNVSPVNLATTIRSAMETVRLAVEAKSIQLEARLNPEIGIVSGDATRLQQVIWNLLSNAVKFTPAGGHIAVELELVDNQAQIIVRDNGKGIAPEFMPHVFDYFRQEDGATTRKFGGLGLGLAIVRQIVELHGGTVRAESQGEGLGATFTVRLPRNNVSIQSTVKEPDSPSCSLELNGIQVLVVDDEADSRDFVAFVVEQAGANVKTAASAKEAIAILMHTQLDVLLSDIGMPDMDGYMLMQQVRALPPEQNGLVLAIALTAYAGDFNQQQALSTGFQRHVAKPVEPEALVQAIATLIRSNP